MNKKSDTVKSHAKTIFMISIIFFVISVVGSPVFSKKMPKGQPDFLPLLPKVTGIRIEEKITQKNVLGRSTSISAKEGYKLIVVTLKGMLSHEVYYTYTPASFFVFYEHEVIKKYGSSKGELESVEEFIRAAAVKLSDFGWYIRPKDGSCTIKQLVRPGPLTIEIAAIVPKDVECCSIIIPTLAIGEAILPTKAKIQSGDASETSGSEKKQLRLTNHITVTS